MRTTITPDVTAWPTFEAGMKIRFVGEKQAYTVQAFSRSGRYVVCTKPFNARRTILHTVLDLVLGVRGTGTSWNLGYGTPAACQDAAAEFEAADIYAALARAGGPPADFDDPQWLAEHPELVGSDGRRFLAGCEVSFRNWVWIRLDDRQGDIRTAALIDDIRALVAAAPERNYNDFEPRTPEELAYMRSADDEIRMQEV